MVATAFPPLELRKIGRAVPEHRGGAREHAGDVADEHGRDERRHEALSTSITIVGTPTFRPIDAPDVRCADLAEPTRRMSIPRTSRTSQYPSGASRPR